MTKPFPVDHLLRAVRLEIEAALLDTRSDDACVPMRLTHSDQAGVYEFETRRKSPPLSKVLIRGTGSARWTSGSAMWLSDNQVRVTVETPIHESLDHAELRDDSTAPLRALERRIDSAPGSIDMDRAGWVVGQGRPESGRRVDPASWIRNYRQLQLNTQQRAAIESALGSELTFVWGPPGTGKTAVVGHIIEGCVRQQHRVLFLAPTNVAVDQALERVCDLLHTEPAFRHGLVQRVGSIEALSLADRYGLAIDPEQLANQLDSNIHGQLTTAQQSREQWLVLLDDLEERDQLSAWRSARDAEAKIANEIRQIGQPSGLFAQRAHRKLEQLRRDLATQQGEQARTAALVGRIGQVRKRRMPRPESVDPRIAQLSEALAGVEREGITAALDEIDATVANLNDQRGKVRELIAAQCRVMGATVSKAIQSPRLLDNVDVVIVDEAAMVNLPSAWCIAGMARRRIVFAGDFRQLPAVTQASGSRSLSDDDRNHARLWMDRDVFHAAGLLGPDGKIRPDPRLVALSEQYRMRTGICDLVNAIAYPDMPLTTGRAESISVSEESLVASPLVLIDTSGAQGRLGYPGQVLTGSPTSNHVHRAVIHELVRALQYESVLPARYSNEGRADSTLAVITPYRDQVHALTASLNYRFGEKYTGLVDTVHRFQGSERPIVIIDTVAGAGKDVGAFYKSAGLSSSTCRLLNVAVSRARDHLVVVADLSFLREKLLENGEARRMVDYLSDYAYRISVDELIPIRSADELGKMSSDQLARPAFFPHDEVPLAVDWDLQRAGSSIDIYCAFLDTEAVNRWLPRLAARIKLGIAVRIYTRNHQSGSKAGQLMQRLREAGCEMHCREQMHEKVVIIDEEVLWHGSLNLLANRGPSDLMMRITDKGSCERVRKIIERSRRDQSDDHRRNLNRSNKPATVEGDRRYLRSDIPMADNAEIKRTVKGRWDPARRQWWVSKDVPVDLIKKWL
ncbi:AAA domain-containing protein [Nocardia tengchongensis]|uniref:AAA domain-containing protein n=1 Tax=Nocardia tengchongensis TaxID=2055889 RepID=UPI003622B100